MWGSRHNSLPRGGLFTDSTTKNSSNHKKIVLLPKLFGGLDEENNKNLKRLPSPLCLEAVGAGALMSGPGVGEALGGVTNQN